MTQPSVFRGMIGRLGPKPLPAPVSGALEKLLRVDQFERLYADAASQHGGVTFAGKVLAALNVAVSVTAEDLVKIPRTGPVVVVANHPFGMIEAAALDATLLKVRPDVRVLANELLSVMPELNNHVIPVNPFGGAEAARANRRSLREALRWLESGGVLAVFPAGEVAHLDMKRRGVIDPPWNPAAARLALQTGAKVVPVHFNGSNGPLFQIAGLMHPRLRTALLPHELLNKRNRTIEMRIGHACSPAPIDELRRRTDWLKLRREQIRRVPSRRMAPIGASVPEDWLAAEIEALPPGARLISASGHEVWLARAADIPMSLRELGRLREVTFRLAGEGTGHACDLDSFDEEYLHLILWCRESRRIQGAYRLALCDGERNIYTSTLFKLSPAFFRRMGPSIELGRSFIRVEAQRNFQALLLLWRGIGEFLLRHPKYRRMFGPVSISGAYRQASRGLIARFLTAHHFDPELAALVTPRRPFAPRPTAPWPEPAGLDDLDRLVRDVELDGKGIPVLLRQYLRLNGRLCAFNIDPAFGNCLDGLIVVDLDTAPKKQLERYMG
jgi:putative hemolysin